MVNKLFTMLYNLFTTVYNLFTISKYKGEIKKKNIQINKTKKWTCGIIILRK